MIDSKKVYSIENAIELLKKISREKFDSTIEIHAHLGIDPKQSNQHIRSTVTLPHSFGKQKIIIAFVPPDKEKDAKDAGADIVGGSELITQIKDTGKINFDIAVAVPEMMKELTTIAKILGPKGLMPSPKNETISPNIQKTIHELRKGKMNYKSDDTANVHLIIGKRSMETVKLTENFQVLVGHLKRNKPAGSKGNFIRTLRVCSTMSPAISVEIPK